MDPIHSVRHHQNYPGDANKIIEAIAAVGVVVLIEPLRRGRQRARREIASGLGELTRLLAIDGGPASGLVKQARGGEPVDVDPHRPAPVVVTHERFVVACEGGQAEARRER